MKTNENIFLQSLVDCVSEVKIWMADNFLQINDSKTEVLVFGRSNCSANLSKTLCSITKTLGTWNLGVIFDLALKFDSR